MSRIRIQEKLYKIKREKKQKQTIMQTLEMIGKEVGKLCYRNEMVIMGVCRLCGIYLSKMGKIVMSCAQEVQRGTLELDIDNNETKRHREGVMLVHLSTHPLDCPICDQASECDLQEALVKEGEGIRHNMSPNHKTESPMLVNEMVKATMTRCILCSRCVTWMDTKQVEKKLGLLGRGVNTEIHMYTTSITKKKYSIMQGTMLSTLVDICPVGAFTSNLDKYTHRPYEAESVETVDVLDWARTPIRVELSAVTMKIFPKPRREEYEKSKSYYVPSVSDWSRRLMQEINNVQIKYKRLRVSLLDRPIIDKCYFEAMFKGRLQNSTQSVNSPMLKLSLQNISLVKLNSVNTLINCKQLKRSTSKRDVDFLALGGIEFLLFSKIPFFFCVSYYFKKLDDVVNYYKPELSMLMAKSVLYKLDDMVESHTKNKVNINSVLATKSFYRLTGDLVNIKKKEEFLESLERLFQPTENFQLVEKQSNSNTELFMSSEIEHLSFSYLTQLYLFKKVIQIERSKGQASQLKLFINLLTFSNLLVEYQYTNMYNIVPLNKIYKNQQKYQSSVFDVFVLYYIIRLFNYSNSTIQL